MKKIGLCLTGGGARGAYQIGALAALEELGILQQINYFSGTSIGAANLALIVSRSVDVAKEVWLSVEGNPLKPVVPLRKRFTIQYLRSIDQGLYDIHSLEEILLSKVDFNGFQNKYAYVTISDGGQYDKGVFDLIKNTFSHYIKKKSKAIYLPIHELESNDILKAVLSSCAIPVIFPSIKRKEKKYYDGGLFDNIPIKPLIDAGCDTIIIIHLNKTHFFNTKKYSGVEFIELKAKKSLGPVLNFSLMHTKPIYELGYQDAMEKFNEFGASLNQIKQPIE